MSKFQNMVTYAWISSRSSRKTRFSLQFRCVVDIVTAAFIALVFYGWLPNMLILSRKVGEQILVGKDIMLTVVKTSTGAVRIGITAPPEVTITRGELIQKKSLRSLRTFNATQQ
jgi:carbon storage regulator CsrA